MKTRRKDYKPVFHREKRRKVTVPMLLEPAVARALKRIVKRNGYSSVGTTVERLVVLFLAADQHTRCDIIQAGVYAPDENHVARRTRQNRKCPEPRPQEQAHGDTIVSTGLPDLAGYVVKVASGTLIHKGEALADLLDHFDRCYQQSAYLSRDVAVRNAFAAGIKVGRRIAAEDDDQAGEEWKQLGSG